MKFQKGWPPIRRDTVEEMKAEAAAWRAIPGVSMKKTGSLRTTTTSSDSNSLKGRFRADMQQAFSEEERYQIFEEYVRKVQHGKTGYGGQPRERAEGIVLRMWQELQEEES